MYFSWYTELKITRGVNFYIQETNANGPAYHIFTPFLCTKKLLVQKAGRVGWCNDYEMVRNLRLIDVAIMKAATLDKVLHKWMYLLLVIDE